MLIMSMIEDRRRKRLILQRTFRKYTMRQFTLREIDRRVQARKTLVEEVEHATEERFKG